MQHFSRKKPPVLVSAFVTGPAEGYIGDPPSQCVLNGKDQYSKPLAVTAVAWRSSNPVIASVDAVGRLTDLTEGEVQIEGQSPDGRWWG